MVVLPAIRIQPGLPVLPRHSAPLPGPLQRSVKALHLALSLWMSNAAPVQPNALSHQPQRQLRPPKLRVGAPPRRAVIHQHRFRNTAALEGFHRLRPSLRPFEVHLPEFVGLTALEALRSRGAALICSDQTVATQYAMNGVARQLQAFAGQQHLKLTRAPVGIT